MDLLSKNDAELLMYWLLKRQLEELKSDKMEKLQKDEVQNLKKLTEIQEMLN